MPICYRPTHLAQIWSEVLPDSHLIARSISRHGRCTVEKNPVVLKYRAHTDVGCLCVSLHGHENRSAKNNIFSYGRVSRLLLAVLCARICGRQQLTWSRRLFECYRMLLRRQSPTLPEPYAAIVTCCCISEGKQHKFWKVLFDLLLQPEPFLTSIDTLFVKLHHPYRNRTK